MKGTAQRFSDEQLLVKELIQRAIDLHYGNRKDKPVAMENVTYQEFNIHHRVFVATGILKANIFDQQQGAVGQYVTNLTDPTLSQKKLRILFGMSLLEAAGTAAVGAEVSTNLSFVAITNNNVENGTINLEFNKDKKVFVDQQIARLFQTNDDIPGYHRFISPVVQEPGGKVKCSVEFPVSLGANGGWLNATLFGIELDGFN